MRDRPSGGSEGSPRQGAVGRASLRDSGVLRAVLRRAVGHGEPDLSRLEAAMPAILARASRRRAEAALPSARLTASGRAWLPRLAAATVVLVVAALIWPGSSRSGGSEASGSASSATATATTDSSRPSSFDEWVVGDASESDPVLHALVD